jgi:hypothetical protein
VAGEFGMDWRIAHDAFVAYADEVLPEVRRRCKKNPSGSFARLWLAVGP